jgi:hypothetical protein
MSHAKAQRWDGIHVSGTVIIMLRTFVNLSEYMGPLGLGWAVVLEG